MTASEYRRLHIAEGWARVGDDALEGARACRTAERWRSAVSRSYYAAYSYGASVLAGVGVDFKEDRVGPEHEPLPDLIRDHLKQRFARNAIKEIRTTLRSLYELRLTADYRPHKIINQQMAVDAERYAIRVRKLVERELP